MKRFLKNRKNALILLIALVSVLAVAIVLTVAVDMKRRAEEEKKLSAFEAESYTYQVEKQNLLIQYASVEKDQLDKLADGSYIGIMFTELNYQLYNDVFPMFLQKANGMVRETPIIGFMCLGDGNMPGDEGLISRTNFDIMVEAGWEYVLYWNGEGSLEEYVPAMKARFASMGLDFPNTIMFKDRTYKTEYDNYLYTQNLIHVIHHGEEGLPIIDKSTDSKVWHPGIIGWNTRGLSNLLLNEIVNKGGVAMFEVNFTDPTGVFLFDRNYQNRVDAFGRMLDVIEKLILEDDVLCTDFDRAKEGRKVYVEMRVEVMKDVEIRRAEIQQRIEELDSIINKIYDKHYNA